MAAADRAQEAAGLIVGRVRRPHGVRGEVLIRLDTDRPKQVFRKGRKLSVADERGQVRSGDLEVLGTKSANDGLILRLAGVDSREASEALRGAVLLIDETEAAPPDADEVHFKDLVGMKVLEGEVTIGEVVDILEMASGQTLIVRRQGKGEALIPFVRAMVEAVDLESRTLRVRLPEGLLEL
jgi:16S rRNA processing protein RimM